MVTVTSQDPVSVMLQHEHMFTKDFLRYLPDNLHVYEAFESEAFKVIQEGFEHYSARTIVHFLRHHSALIESDNGGWKINNNHSPYLARLFDLMHPEHVGLWEYRETKAAA
jgi:hypothetical protein